MVPRIRFRLLGVVPLLAVLSCKPDGGIKRAQWNQAVAQKNGAGAWKALDSGTQQIILDGLKRSQAKAKSDPAFQVLFAGACAPADSSQSPEALAETLLSNADLAFSMESDARSMWPPVPVGYCTPDGCPVTLALRDRPPAPPPAGTSYRIAVDPNGKTMDEVHQTYAMEVKTLVPLQHWTPACGDQMTKVLNVYFDQLIPREAYKLTFEVEGDGSLTPVFEAFNRATYRNEAKAEPRLAYIAWPRK